MVVCHVFMLTLHNSLSDLKVKYCRKEMYFARFMQRNF